MIYLFKMTPETIMADWARIFFFPLMLVVAWLYFPFCESGPTFCIWSVLFGRSCPGCGLSRGMCYLVRGHFSRALVFNVFTPFVFCGVFAISFKAACQVLLNKYKWRRLFRDIYGRSFNSGNCGG